MFKSEADLCQEFNEVVHEKKIPFKTCSMANEFDYREGRIDIIATNGDGDLIAFEMKLEKWRKALDQAYRNTSFAHYSYVVLPLMIASKAAKWEKEFLRRGVGLCTVNLDNIEIIIEAKRNNPLRPWLTHVAIDYIAEASGGVIL